MTVITENPRVFRLLAPNVDHAATCTAVTVGIGHQRRRREQWQLHGRDTRRGPLAGARRVRPKVECAKFIEPPIGDLTAG